MQPDDNDVQQMVAALMTVLAGVDRARRRGDASTLALLQALAHCERARPSELASALGLHQSSVTRQMQVLEQAGQVKVVADPEDGRSCFVSLSSVGREELQRLTEVGLKRFASFVADWDAEEVRTLARLLNKLETSKSKVNQRERRPAGRHWQHKQAGS